MRVAALDLGSNTFLMLVVDVEQGKILRTLTDELRVVRLSQAIDRTGEFHPDALKRADQCFAEYREIMDRLGVEQVVAVATSAARDARNRDEFFALAKRHAIPVRVISGDFEAELTFLGSTFDRARLEGLAVLDIGGGSTEVVSQTPSGLKGVSIDMGSVRLTERLIEHQPLHPEDRQRLLAHVEKAFGEAHARLPAPTSVLLAVAGTPTTLAAVAEGKPFSEDYIEGYRLKKEWLERTFDRFAAMSIEERQQVPGMDPKRADVLVAGMAILLGAMRALNVTEVTVSVRGVRFGLALTWERVLSLPVVA